MAVTGSVIRFLMHDAEQIEIGLLLVYWFRAPSVTNFFKFSFDVSRFLSCQGPDELPLFLEDDEELTALAEESAGAAQGLATQLSAVRRSHMACWGIDASKGGDSSSRGEFSAIAATDGDDEEAKLGEGKTADVRGKEAVAAREHGNCMGWWGEVLGRWHERTQLVDPSLQKKFRVVNQGPWAQVTTSLADRDRANRRAFMTESEVGA